MNVQKQNIIPDTWQSLKAFTNARIALGRTGVAIPLKEVFDLKLSHAHARSAVYSQLEKDKLIESLKQFQLPVITVRSKAKDRTAYLQRPDKGRQLDTVFIEKLKGESSMPSDVVIVLADGLSATAINCNAMALLEKLIPLFQQAGLSIAPIVIAEQARVAIGDETGFLLKAKVSLVLIGERPGLSSCDSIGAYITYSPLPGLTDEARNCVSNIHPAGLSNDIAAEKICYLIQSSLQLKISGIQLKDEQLNLGI